jgi:hypothetical protein
MDESRSLFGTSIDPESFPPAFSRFLQEYGICPNQYLNAHKVQRCIRIHPSCTNLEQIHADIESDLNTRLEKIEGCDHFYKLKDNVKIASSKL